MKHDGTYAFPCTGCGQTRSQWMKNDQAGPGEKWAPDRCTGTPTPPQTRTHTCRDNGFGECGRCGGYMDTAD